MLKPQVGLAPPIILWQPPSPLVGGELPECSAPCKVKVQAPEAACFPEVTVVPAAWAGWVSIPDCSVDTFHVFGLTQVKVSLYAQLVLQPCYVCFRRHGPGGRPEKQASSQPSASDLAPASWVNASNVAQVRNALHAVLVHPVHGLALWQWRQPIVVPGDNGRRRKLVRPSWWRRRRRRIQENADLTSEKAYLWILVAPGGQGLTHQEDALGVGFVPVLWYHGMLHGAVEL
mmetsp:Transcript_61461/g.143077  ORF Transcript_61461/g.143077 Transcript_61461/m.143077 type:complete len:231 (-) Transcript_61461:500-1192(-)